MVVSEQVWCIKIWFGVILYSLPSPYPSPKGRVNTFGTQYTPEQILITVLLYLGCCPGSLHIYLLCLICGATAQCTPGILATSPVTHASKTQPQSTVRAMFSPHQQVKTLIFISRFDKDRRRSIISLIQRSRNRKMVLFVAQKAQWAGTRHNLRVVNDGLIRYTVK